MQNESSTIFLDLTSVAIEQPHLIFRNSLWFEKSGASMAVYNHRPKAYPNGHPPYFDGSYESAVAMVREISPYIARVDLRDASYRSFLEGIDEYLMLRYLKGAA